VQRAGRRACCPLPIGFPGRRADFVRLERDEGVEACVRRRARQQRIGQASAVVSPVRIAFAASATPRSSSFGIAAPSTVFAVLLRLSSAVTADECIASVRAAISA
jgi:hypothetical protein